jgi:hypothetical protein
MSSAIGHAPAIGSKGVRHFAGSFVVAVRRLVAFRRISTSHGGSVKLAWSFNERQVVFPGWSAYGPSRKSRNSATGPRIRYT